MDTEVFEIPPGPDATAGLSLFVPVAWVNSPRAHRLTLSVPRRGAVRITLPRGMKRETALAFLHDKAAWLRRALARRERHPQPSPAAVTLGAHLEKFPWVSIAGKLCALECAETMSRPFHVFHEREALVLFRHRGGVHREGDLRRLVRELAAETLPVRVAELARRAGITVRGVSVRDQRGRWGSCSARATLSLNWRLVLLPPVMQDHVILHELAHRREMNHSARFWNQLAKWDPDCASNNRMLSKQWHGLMDIARGTA
ncbi:MAG: M48 family metallopeptidase [Puniceicoccales bacterium]|jgi:predicted metal-dependent hydrolase|nr:M48 family metallopeptidase [Puniceicoccales bacterium]